MQAQNIDYVKRIGLYERICRHTKNDCSVQTKTSSVCCWVNTQRLLSRPIDQRRRNHSVTWRRRKQPYCNMTQLLTWQRLTVRSPKR